MEYSKAVSEYFKEKGERFIKKYPNFECLNNDHSQSLKKWKEVKDDIKGHEVYHWHANLSTTFKTIKNKLKK